MHYAIELRRRLREAILESLMCIHSAHDGEAIDGYALCTDEDLISFFPVAASREFRRESQNDEARFVPVDWTFDEGREAFPGVTALLRHNLSSAGSAEAFRVHVDTSFESATRVLEELREEGHFRGASFLWVTSTDPGPALQQLGREAARRLNSREEFDAWAAVME
jgi:hypothetical protein